MIRQYYICDSIMKGLPMQQAKIMALFIDIDELTVKGAVNAAITIPEQGMRKQMDNLCKKGLLAKTNGVYTVRNRYMKLFLKSK